MPGPTPESAPETSSAPRRDLLGTLLCALAAAGWGCWSLFLRGSGLHPSWQSVLILVVITLGSLPSVLFGKPPHDRPRRAGLWAQMALLGLLDAGNYILYFSAVDRGPVGVAVLTHYLAPVLVAALAPALLQEPLGRSTPWALAGALAGLGLLVLGGGGLSSAALPAALLGGASAFFYGGNLLLSKRLLADFSGAELLVWHCAVSALLLAGLALAPAGVPGSAGGLPALSALFVRPLLGSVLLGVIGAQLFYVGLRRIPAQEAAVLAYLEPLVASAVGVFAWGERLGPSGVFGGLLICAGGLLVALDRRPAAPAPERV
jgi:drug/metabolite transporter (DMT)-like permease